MSDYKENIFVANATDVIQFDKSADGLVPVVVQNANNFEILMMGFMNREALDKTLSTGLVTFWTRSRQRLWTKGETSGNVLKFKSLRINCNNDSLVVLAEPVGATCHTGHPTCYYRELSPQRDHWMTISSPQFDPDQVYQK
jgi:phosphoribosyl-ATP pyrophosphohydrolase/phosphoribosyl-AMP cyclohydrolase